MLEISQTAWFRWGGPKMQNFKSLERSYLAKHLTPPGRESLPAGSVDAGGPECESCWCGGKPHGWRWRWCQTGLRWVWSTQAVCSLGVCCSAALCTQLGTFSLEVLHLCLIFSHLTGNCSQHVKYVKTCSVLFFKYRRFKLMLCWLFSPLKFSFERKPVVFFFKLLVITSLCCLLVLLNLVNEGWNKWM